MTFCPGCPHRASYWSINNALVLLNISVYWQGIVSGLVLLAAVIFDIWSKRQRTA